MTPTQQSLMAQLTAHGVPEDIASSAAIALSDGLGTVESPAVAAVYPYLVPQLSQEKLGEPNLKPMTNPAILAELTAQVQFYEIPNDGWWWETNEFSSNQGFATKALAQADFNTFLNDPDFE